MKISILIYRFFFNNDLKFCQNLDMKSVNGIFDMRQPPVYCLSICGGYLAKDLR